MHRSRRRFLAASAGLAAAPAYFSVAPAVEFELRCGSDVMPSYPSSVRLTQMWAAVERESRGRVRVRYYPNSQLGSVSSMFSQMRLGALTFVLVPPGNLGSVVPSAEISLIGFAFADKDEAFRAMDGPLGGYVRQEAAQKGIHAFRTMWDSPMQHIGSGTRPIVTRDDMHGFKVRVPESRISVDLFKTLGANPSALSFSELYTALQTKLLDGEVGSLVSIETNRFYEVNRYVSLTNHGWIGLWLAANGDQWNSLPPDVQQLIETNNTKYGTMLRRDTTALDISLRDKLKRQGMAINDVDQTSFRAVLHPYFQTWATEFGPTEWGLLETALGRRLT